jgi:putative transposase
VFEDLDQVREITAGWITTYNERRPHESLGDLPPSIFGVPSKPWKVLLTR